MKAQSTPSSTVRRGRFARAGLLLSLSLASLTLSVAAGAQPLARNVGGLWEPPIDFGLVSVSMANLPDGRVLAFASNERDAFPGGRPEFTYATVFDPTDESLSEIHHPAHDMFCASLVMLEDGSVFISGGRNQALSPWTSIFDFNTDSWIPLENMNKGRWYPTSIALPSGQVMIAGGIGGEEHPEMWTSGSGWQLLTGIDLTDALEIFSERDGSDLWPLLQLEPAGTIVHLGAEPVMHRIDPFTGLGNLQTLGPHNLNWYPDEGTSVLFDEGMVLVSGGSLARNNNNSSDQAVVIDVNGPGPQITPTGTMQEPRQFHNEILLPNGKVLVVGGNRDGRKFNDDQAVFQPEVWDPATGSWTLMNPQQIPRTYHSVATLLVDGRVLSAGGGLSGGNPSVNHWDGEIFSPPYLFDAAGDPAVRPVIGDAPDVVRVGASFTMQASANLADVTMVRMSATTHTMNTDLRFLRAGFTETSPGSYDVTLHANENVLMPGYWMLFGLDAAGVPSEAKVIQVVTSGEPRGTPIPDQRSYLGATILLQIDALDPDGNPLTYSATGLPVGLSLDPNTGVIQGTLAQTGIYNVSVTIDDGSEAAILSFQWFVTLADSEVGTVTVSQSGPGQWHAVALQNIYNQPVVVMGPPSSQDGDPTTIRVANVSASSFEFQIDEWDYLDGAHGSETFSYLVVEAGSHAIPGGGALVAGVSPGVDDNFRPVPLPAGAFIQTPVILSQAASANGSQAVTTRTQGVTTSEFQIRLQRQEGSAGGTTPDDVHWIAVDVGVISGVLEAGVTADSVDQSPESIAYSQGFSGAPHFLANLQTYDGGDTIALRHAQAAANGIEITGEEEAAADTEISHTTEIAGWLAIDPSESALGLLPLFNQPPSIVDPGDQLDAENDAVDFTLVSNDPDGDNLAFVAAGLPPGLAIDAANGRIHGTLTTAGTYNVTVTATDTSGASGGVSFDWTVNAVLQLLALASPPRLDGTDIAYTADTNIPGAYQYTWDFGDGSPAVGPSSDPNVSHTFPGTGHWVVTLSILDPGTGATDSTQFTQMVHAPLTAESPTMSSSIAYEAANDRVWVANPDNDTLSVLDGIGHTKIDEIVVGASPRSVAVAGDGRIWVTNKRDASISIVDPGTRQVVASVLLAKGSEPHGLAFAPDGSVAYVSLEGTGEVLRLDGTNGAQLGSQAVGVRPRGLGVNGDGSALYVSLFVAPPLPGEEAGNPQVTVASVRHGAHVVQLDPASLAIDATIVLHHDDDAITTEFSGPGLPNYIGAPALSPDGTQAWVPSKQDNILRGSARSGFPLTHDSTVRAVTSRFVTQTSSEDESARIDHDDASMVSASLFGPFGAYVLSALEGNREVAVIDALSRGEIGRFAVGRAPQGMASSPDGRTLFVHNFMDRSVSVHDMNGLYDFADTSGPIVATIPLVASELLAPDVLLGKQLFYDADDERLVFQSYFACSACHNDGDNDGRTWDFTQFGEGFRNTIDLRGRGQGHGPVHWTANFDEIQDFEGQIRLFALGTGLMSQADFDATVNPLGAPKAGLSSDLDALAAYVQSLTETGDSPFKSGGILTNAGEAGKQVFLGQACDTCHGGTPYTDSAQVVKHDVGTSGGLPLDTPTLRGLWRTGPYLHDGSAASLEDAVNAHSGVALSGQPLADLTSYLLQIDDAEQIGGNVIPPAGGVISGTTSGVSEHAGSCSSGATGDAPEQAYEWTPAVSGPVTIETCSQNTLFDTVLYAREGALDGAALTCNDDTSGCGVNDGSSTAHKRGSRIQFTALAGQTYYFFVDGYRASGDFELTIAPTSGAACGDNVTEGTEVCDGTDDAACPGLCQSNCTCAPPPVCGNGATEIGEQCDGADDSACPGLCQADCSCGTPPPVCGNGVVEGSEACDGGDDAACPGLCQSDCSCGSPPVCGNDVTESGEQCDGSDDAACPGLCDGGCSCNIPAPVCGNDLTEAGEQCDGSDDGLCPGLCQAGCTCATPGVPVIPPAGGIVAGTTSGPSDYEGSCSAGATRDSSDQPFQWTAAVSGPVTIETCSQDTLYDTVLYAKQGDLNGAFVGCNDDTAGCGVNDGSGTAHRRGSRVSFTAVAGETYYFFVDGYRASGNFELTVSPTAGAACGDNVTEGTEVCDGSDDAACPGLCQSNCTCGSPPVCGDNVSEGTEACDGTDDAACPGLCLGDCTCGTPPPVCGNGVVEGSESCDGADDAACPGLCQSDCSCAPPPVCGNDVMETGEQCDGSDDAACPGLCDGSCACNFPPPVCGNDVTEAGEQCDGSDVAACGSGVCYAPGDPGGVACTCVPPVGGPDPELAGGTSADMTPNGTSFAIAYPADVAAGDELLIWVGTDGDPAGVSCTNFERLLHQEENGTVQLSVLRRRATGPHTGFETCSWDPGESQSGGLIMTRVTNAARLRPPLGSFTSSSDISNPPGIPIPVANALVLTACAHDGTGNSVSDPPAGYLEEFDGVGADSSGTNISLASKVVTASGFEDPGPFTNWSRSDGSACVTLAYDNGSVVEPAFAQNFDATSGGQCEDEGALDTSASGDCDCASGQCATTNQGGQAILLPSVTLGTNHAVLFREKFADIPASGCFVMDFEMNLDALGTGNSTFLDFFDGNSNAGPNMRYQASSGEVGMRCTDNAAMSSTWTPTADTTYKMRIEYCFDSGPGNCPSNPANCEDCGCLYADTTGDFGTTAVDHCDGVGVSLPINGWSASPGNDNLDLILDDIGICPAAPLPGDKCGD